MFEGWQRTTSRVSRRRYKRATHHLICPYRGLCFELRAVADLQGTRAAPWKEVCDLFPSEVFLLLQVD